MNHPSKPISLSGQVAIVASSAASPFTNGDALVMEFTRNGDKGDTGAAGAAGTSGFTRTARAASMTSSLP